MRNHTTVFFKNNQAFHIPKNKLYSDPSISDKKELTNFSSTPTNEVGLTEKQCLTYINSEFNISPNRFINTNNQESIWGYLP